MNVFSIQSVQANDPLVERQLLFDMVRDTFVETFGHAYSPRDLETYSEARLTGLAIQQELESPDSTFHLLFRENVCVGYLKWIVPSFMYLDQETCQFARPFLLERFYILSACQGMGIAPVALQFVLSQAKYVCQADYIYLSVWENNLRAQHFYQNFGFRTIGTSEYPVGETVDREFLYGRVP